MGPGGGGINWGTGAARAGSTWPGARAANVGQQWLEWKRGRGCGGGPFPQDQQEAAQEFTGVVRDQMSLRKATVSPCLGRV